MHARRKARLNSRQDYGYFNKPCASIIPDRGRDDGYCRSSESTGQSYPKADYILCYGVILARPHWDSLPWYLILVFGLALNILDCLNTLATTSSRQDTNHLANDILKIQNILFRKIEVFGLWVMEYQRTDRCFRVHHISFR
jgi:hypothetical protein